jgi:hypothetical protein
MDSRLLLMVQKAFPSTGLLFSPRSEFRFCTNQYLLRFQVANGGKTGLFRGGEGLVVHSGHLRIVARWS